MIGPAVDHAAEYLNEPEGAFIWVLPDVAQRYSDFRTRALELINQPHETILAAHAIALERGAKPVSEMVNHPEVGSDAFMEGLRMTYAQILAVPVIIENYPMPTKHGSVIDSAIINPLVSARTEEESNYIMGRYEQFLRGDRMDVWIKRQNTLKFLDAARKAVVQFRSQLSGEFTE